MKNLNLIMTYSNTAINLSILIVFMLFFGCNSDNENDLPNIEVGEIGPSGGFVFFDKGEYTDGWRYIEAAPNDLEGMEWGCFDSPILDSRQTGVGFGLQNTLAIVTFHDSFDDYYNNPEQCSDMSNGTVAAKACTELVVLGFDNWHLPSEGEMLLMYENLHLNGLGNFDTVSNKLYWTSTEHDDNTATATDFSNGDQGWLCKQCDLGQSTKIRAVRYF